MQVGRRGARNEPVLQDKYDMAMGGMSQEKLNSLMYNAARLEELEQQRKIWGQLGE